MDKKEILEKNKRTGLDEREQRVYNRSFGFGAVVVCLLCVVFALFKAFHYERFYEFGAIMTAYLCTAFLYQFKNLKKAPYLIAGICTGLATIILVVMFFMEYI